MCDWHVYNKLLLTYLRTYLEMGPLKPARGSALERCKLPSGNRGGALAENEFDAL